MILYCKLNELHEKKFEYVLTVESNLFRYTISVSAKWELWSSAIKISDIHHCLQKQLDNFYVTTGNLSLLAILFIFVQGTQTSPGFFFFLLAVI